jgi:hypothetical protein
MILDNSSVNVSRKRMIIQGLDDDDLHNDNMFSDVVPTTQANINLEYN